jgi:hypothetical protein
MPRGRPAHQPSDAERRLVERLASICVAEDDIAQCLPRPIDPKTLRRHYRSELDRGRARGRARVLTKLHELIDQNVPSAIFFYLKAQCGWSEKQQVELSGKDGAPLTEATRVVILPSKDAPAAEQSAALEAERAAAAPRHVGVIDLPPKAESVEVEALPAPAEQPVDWREQLRQSERVLRGSDRRDERPDAPVVSGPLEGSMLGEHGRRILDLADQRVGRHPRRR